MAEKDDRLFAPFPIEMDEHPKIIGLSDAAFRAIFEATFYSRRMLSDGFLDERVVMRRWGQACVDELTQNDANRPSWIPVEGGWQIHDFEKHHPLKAEIVQKRADVSAKRSQAGSKGAAKRWQVDSKRMANDSSETETETETLKAPAPAVLVSESDFERAWTHWPKKVERKKSLDKFKAIAKRRGVEELIADIARFGDAYTRTTEKQFVPALNVWLNGERWTDELPGGQVTSAPQKKRFVAHDD